jgi:integrase
MEFKRKVLDGVDPNAKVATVPTFKEACTTYWAGRKDVTDRYKLNAMRGLEMHLWGALGDRPVSQITKGMLLAPLMVLDAQAKYVYARRVRVWAGEVLAWAVSQGYCEDNVAKLIDPNTAFGRRKVKHFASLALKDVHPFLERLSYEKELQSVLATRMLAMTWVRTAELRMMVWDELEGNLWRIPAERMKREKEHLVPLPKQVVEMLPNLKLRCRGSKYVFPSDRRIDRPMSENSILYLLGRIGYEGIATGHGFRSTGSTWANERHYSPDAIEMQLSHSPEDKVRSTYNSAKYLPLRRKILQAYADWLDDPNAGGDQAGEAPAQDLAA